MSSEIGIIDSKKRTAKESKASLVGSVGCVRDRDRSGIGVG